MPQISATVGNSIKGMLDAYADIHGISFSEAVKINASSSIMDWFGALPQDEKKRLDRKFKIFGGKK
jgi:hypothetical protein